MLSILFGVCIDETDIVLESGGSDSNKINKNSPQGENTHSGTNQILKFKVTTHTIDLKVHAWAILFDWTNRFWLVDR